MASKLRDTSCGGDCLRFCRDLVGCGDNRIWRHYVIRVKCVDTGGALPTSNWYNETSPCVLKATTRRELAMPSEINVDLTFVSEDIRYRFEAIDSEPASWNHVFTPLVDGIATRKPPLTVTFASMQRLTWETDR